MIKGMSLNASLSPPPLKILLVDDDADTRQLITVILERAGYTVQSTGHGQSAILLLGHEKIDLVLLDIMIPDVDGLSVLEAIRKVSKAPVLMITALSDARIMEQSYLMGADDYIVKPFSSHKLLERIDRLARQVTSSAEDLNTAWEETYQLDVTNGALVIAGWSIELSPIEVNLLKRLMDSAYIEVSRIDLFKAGWGNVFLPPQTVAALVDNTLHSLQLKIEKDPLEPSLLMPTREGYIFNPE